MAGYENAINLLGHGTVALLRHPGQWAALRADPSLAAATVDEALRYDAPFQFTRRIASTDLDIGGYHIAKGQHVIAFMAAANRDPAQFPTPTASTSAAPPTGTCPSAPASTPASAARSPGCRPRSPSPPSPGSSSDPAWTSSNRATAATCSARRPICPSPLPVCRREITAPERTRETRDTGHHR